MGSSRAQLVVLVPEVAEPLDALPEELLRSRPIALQADDVGEHEQGKGDAPVVMQLAVELERLLGPKLARRDISARQSRIGGAAEGLGARRGRALVSAECSFELTPPLDQMPPQIPESPKRCRQPERGDGVAGRLKPVHGSPKVVVVALQPVEPLGVAAHADQMRLGLLGDTEKVLCVATVKRRRLPREPSRSAAYSRIVPSMVNLGSSSLPSSRVRPLSVNDASPSTASRSSPQTLCAASIVHPPANTASRTNNRCSAGSSS